MFSNITRDDLKWGWGIAGGILVGLAGNLNMFPWFSVTAQHWIALAGFLVAIGSGKFATSPLNGKVE